ncbi:NHLP leader peptide family RiPP precursor [Microbacterium rhizomatis]|uniref:NHLP leader peptide family natural product n=1 Tax=Microbacterium rhizomatis TaxID=1631477 RepID=A0A5J5J233_9MICO|nr:NHLP leader peptide family RiPP precursor [Microbacterium rhizomatis]KAA9108437.1 NHLP leader peptide family natural product precursor [Microbacterium rhizomatis]
MADANNIGKIIAQAWEDDAFKAKLIADPTATLAEAGVTAPEGARFEVVEDTAEVVHLVLPARPSELSDDQLDAVAGGNTMSWTNWATCDSTRTAKG